MEKVIMSRSEMEFVSVDIIYAEGQHTNQTVEMRPTTAELIRRRIQERDENFRNGKLAPQFDLYESFSGNVHCPPGKYFFFLSISSGNAYRTAVETREIAALRNRNELSNIKRIIKINDRYFTASKATNDTCGNLKVCSKFEKFGSGLPVVPEQGPTAPDNSRLYAIGNDNVITDAAVNASDDKHDHLLSPSLHGNQYAGGTASTTSICAENQSDERKKRAADGVQSAV